MRSAFLGFLWCFERVFVRSPSGRDRFNVLGALNAITHQLVTVCNDGYINSQSVCELLTKIADLGADVPVTVVLDNARYHRCALVFRAAEALGIELLSSRHTRPNLNLIERLWKFVKRKALYSKYYPTFTEFKEAISDVLDHTDSTHERQVDTHS